MTEMLRHFTHLVIPAEIWLNKNISIHAKALWAELRSLHDPGAGGCYASDEYLCEFLNLKKSRLYEIIAELKLNNLLTSSFNGRQSIRTAIVPQIDDDRGKQLSGIPESCFPESRNHSYIDNKVLEESNNTPPTPKGGSGRGVSSSSKNDKAYTKPLISKKELHLDCVMLTADEHAKLLELYDKEILEWMLETLNCYLGSSGKKYASHYFVLKKNGWVYKRYQEEVVNNPSLKKKGEYQRSGKLVIEADRLTQATERERFKTTLTEADRQAYLAKSKAASDGDKPK